MEKISPSFLPSIFWSRNIMKYLASSLASFSSLSISYKYIQSYSPVPFHQFHYSFSLFLCPILKCFQSRLRGLWAFFSTLINWFHHADSVPWNAFLSFQSRPLCTLQINFGLCLKLCKRDWRDLFATVWISDEQLTDWPLSTCPFSSERDSSAFHVFLWFKHCWFCNHCFLLTISQACPDVVSMTTCHPFNLFDQGAHNIVHLCNCNLKTAGDILKQKQQAPARSPCPDPLINVISKPLDFWLLMICFIYEKYDIKKRKVNNIAQ